MEEQTNTEKPVLNSNELAFEANHPGRKSYADGLDPHEHIHDLIWIYHIYVLPWNQSGSLAIASFFYATESRNDDDWFWTAGAYMGIDGTHGHI